MELVEKGRISVKLKNCTYLLVKKSMEVANLSSVQSQLHWCPHLLMDIRDLESMQKNYLIHYCLRLINSTHDVVH